MKITPAEEDTIGNTFGSAAYRVSTAIFEKLAG